MQFSLSSQEILHSPLKCGEFVANSESGLQVMGMFAMCAYAERREAGFLPLLRDTVPLERIHGIAKIF